MKLSDLGSNPKILGGGAAQNVLSAALKQAPYGPKGFRYSAPVIGEQYSARVISYDEFPGSVPYSHVIHADEMAGHIVLLTQDARYDPPNQANSMQKGWMIYSTKIGPTSVVLVKANWL